MAGGADLIFICINQGLAALVIQIPAVTALVLGQVVPQQCLSYDSEFYRECLQVCVPGCL